MTLSQIPFRVICVTYLDHELSPTTPLRSKSETGWEGLNTNIKAEALGKMSILAYPKKKNPR